MTGVDWSLFGIRPKAPKPKRESGRPPKQSSSTYGRKPGRFEPGSQELKDKEYERALLRRAKEKYDDDLATYSSVHPNFRKFLATLRREEKTTTMPRSGYLDWDVIGLAEDLQLYELPAEVRWMAFREFHAFLKRITKRKYGDEFGKLLPIGEWKKTDFETMKRALELK